MPRQTEVNSMGYNIRTKLFKAKGFDEKLYHANKAIVFYAKDEQNFTTGYMDFDGIRRKVVRGSISTLELHEGDVNTDDKIEYGGQVFNIESITFDDLNIQKGVRKRVRCKTIINLVR